MPEEIRFIKFTLNEVIEALRELSHKSQVQLPKSSPREAREKKDPEWLVIEFLFTGASSPIKFSNSFVAAALIRFCKKFHIPIPKEEEKSIAVVPGGVILKIGLDRSKGPSATGGKKVGKETNLEKEKRKSESEEFLL